MYLPSDWQGMPLDLTMPQYEAVKQFIFSHAIQWIGALIILTLGLLASKLSRRWLKPVLNRSRVQDDLLLKSFFLRLVSVSIIIAAVIVALEQVNVPVTSLIAGLGITGIILGFALRDTLSNFAAGLLLLIYRPFRAGELIEVEGAHGTVEELTIVNMQITSVDGVRVIMPNSKVWGSKIVNYSLSKQRRLELNLKVRDIDLKHAIATINSAIANDTRILRCPAPAVKVASVTGDSATLIIWAWTNPQDFQSVSADAYLRLLTRLTEAEIQVL
jgi:small conductance mechanosensitive channel